MMLFKVTVEYRDLEAWKKWNEQFSYNHGNVIPTPAPIISTRLVAVIPEFGFKSVVRAAEEGIKTVIGPEHAWEKFQAIVRSVEYVDDVTVHQE